MSKLIAIAGGIGSGKSVVSRLLRQLGFRVVDTDLLARRLMNCDSELKSLMVQEFGSDVYGEDGQLNRQLLAQRVFGNREMLAKLNGIVHPAVVNHLVALASEPGNKVLFAETALLRASGLDRHVHAVWRVTAPHSLRVARVVARNGLTEEQVEQRMRSQAGEDMPGEHDCLIVNDGKCAVIPQVMSLVAPFMD